MVVVVVVTLNGKPLGFYQSLNDLYLYHMLGMIADGQVVGCQYEWETTGTFPMNDSHHWNSRLATKQQEQQQASPTDQPSEGNCGKISHFQLCISVSHNASGWI